MKINLNKGQNVYLTSDTHYSHKNICKATTSWEINRPGQVRDFKSLSHMNQTIVDNINLVVKEDDILIHFGDWSFGGIEQIWEFRKQIICKNIYLIFGNHDEHIITNKILPNIWCNGVWHDEPNPNNYGDSRDQYFDVTTQQLFTWCGHYEEFEIVYPNKKYKFIASHYPIASWNNLGRGVAHFHGHVHLDKQHKIHQGRSMDIGVDGNDFKPYELREAFKLIENNPIASTLLIKDHHVKD